MGFPVPDLDLAQAEGASFLRPFAIEERKTPHVRVRVG